MKLLSDDYGILTEEDMHDKGFQVKIGELGAELESKCINVSYSEELKENSADLDFVVRREGRELRLDFNSITSNNACEEHRSAWKKIMKDANKISGFFHRLKTKKGCDSWFEGDCK